MNILITGATGLIGRALGRELAKQGHRLFVVTRNRSKTIRDLAFPCHIIEADLTIEPIHDERLEEIDTVIHLAGENLADKKWTVAQKKIIYDSRVKGTQNLLNSFTEHSKLNLFISTSAIGYYGDRKSEVLTEESSRGQGFVSDLCSDWEYPVLLAERKNRFSNCRYAILRTGLVLSTQGGFLYNLLTPFRLGGGFILGNGLHWLSWIHIQDLVQIYMSILNDKNLSGVINGVSPEPVTFRDFAKKLASVYGYKVRFTIPEVIFKIFLGELSQLLFSSQRVLPKKINLTTFQFYFDSLEKAFEDLFSSQKKRLYAVECEQFFPYLPEQIRNEVKHLKIELNQLNSRFISFFILNWVHESELSAMSGGSFLYDKIEYTLREISIFKIIIDFYIKKKVYKLFQIRRAMFARKIDLQ